MTPMLRIKNENGEWVEVIALKGDTGPAGSTGPAGADGKTPVKGTDYFTTADKNEIVAQVKSTMYTYSTTDLTAGSSPLTTGNLYFVYE